MNIPIGRIAGSGNAMEVEACQAEQGLRFATQALGRVTMPPMAVAD